MRYDIDDWKTAEFQIETDADFIVSGACNPVAVIGVLHDMLKALRHHKQDLKHPAALVTLSHASYLLTGENVAGDAWTKFFQAQAEPVAC